jgi:hypothetical protein
MAKQQTAHRLVTFDEVDRRSESPGRYSIQLMSQTRTAVRPSCQDGEVLNVVEVSIGGLRMQGARLRRGQRLIVDVPPLGERGIEVRWVKEGRAGCRFTEPLNAEELCRVLTE